jgi:hypothetical protein
MKIQYKYILFAIFFSITSLSVKSQNHDYIWWYEYNKRVLVNFNYSPPKITADNRKNESSTYTGILSDSAGQSILYYTNGLSVYSSDRQIMQYGDSINFGPMWLWSRSSSIQSYNGVISPFFLPRPGYPNHYVLLHIKNEIVDIYDDGDPEIIIDPLYYTIIDGNANNGLGKVISKNQVLATGDLIWVNACKHGNGRDWWVVTAQLNSPDLLLYLLDPNGWSGPFVHEGSIPFPRTEVTSQSVFSPDGRYYVRNDGRNGLRIYDFDRCDGTFSNMRYLEFDSLNTSFITWSTAFSPDSRYLNISKLSMVWQIDMKADSLAMDTVMRWPWVSCAPQYNDLNGRIAMMQLAPDGKIYASASQGTALCYSVIHQPNLAGQSIDGHYSGQPLEYFNNGTLQHFPNYRLGELEGSPCDTLNGQRSGDGFVKSYPYPKVEPPNGYRVIKTYHPGQRSIQRQGSMPPDEQSTPSDIIFERMRQGARLPPSQVMKPKQ